VSAPVEPKARTQADILDRFRAAADDDMFGWRREVLTLPMTNESVRKALPAAEIADGRTPATLDQVTEDAQGYLAFAVEKILGHRGISASRSVQKLTEFAWLLGRDDVVEAIGAAEYAQYGAPQIRAFAEGMGWPFLDVADVAAEREQLERMSLGRFCEDECLSGCGQ
jgi:hypothetical protein